MCIDFSKYLHNNINVEQLSIFIHLTNLEINNDISDSSFSNITQTFFF